MKKRTAKARQTPDNIGQSTRIEKSKCHWEQAFLKMLEGTANVQEACKTVGVARSTVYERRAKDSQFAERWTDAIEGFCDNLEEECIRRAMHGVERGIYYKGKRIATERDYSDRLLEFLLKKYRPEFRDNHSVSQPSEPVAKTVRFIVEKDRDTPEGKSK